MTIERLRQVIDLRWLFLLFGLTALILSIRTSWLMHQTYTQIKHAHYLKTSQSWRATIETQRHDRRGVEALVQVEPALKYVSIAQGGKRIMAGKTSHRHHHTTPPKRSLIILNPQRVIGIWRPKQAGLPIMTIEFVPLETMAMMRGAQRTFYLSVGCGVVFFLLSVLMTLLLTRRALAQRAVEKQRLLSSLGQMSSVISHELRNPLMAAMGQAALLQETLQGDQRQHRAERVVRELDRIEQLSERLLAFINSGRISRIHQDCKAFVAHLKEVFDSPRIVFIINDLPREFYFDPVTLERALANLLNNAMQMSDENTVVDLTIGMSEDDMLCFDVRDHGPGIPEDLDIMTPFVTKRKGGTGLGLAITAEIVRAHDGTIETYNHEDGGAVFHLCLPRVEIMTVSTSTALYI